MASPGEDFSGFSQGEEERPGRAEREILISQLEAETRGETVALAQAGPRHGVQSPAPRFKSGGTGGRPKIFLLEDWNGAFSSKLPKLGNILSRLMQNLRSDPNRQGGQSNSSTLVSKLFLRKRCQAVISEVKGIWRNNMTARIIDGTAGKSFKDLAAARAGQSEKFLFQDASQGQDQLG